MLSLAEPYIVAILSDIVHVSPIRKLRHRSFDSSKNKVARELSSKSAAGGEFALELAPSLLHTSSVKRCLISPDCVLGWRRGSPQSEGDRAAAPPAGGGRRKGGLCLGSGSISVPALPGFCRMILHDDSHSLRVLMMEQGHRWVYTRGERRWEYVQVLNNWHVASFQWMATVVKGSVTQARRSKHMFWNETSLHVRPNCNIDWKTLVTILVHSASMSSSVKWGRW